MPSGSLSVEEYESRLVGLATNGPALHCDYAFTLSWLLNCAALYVSALNSVAQYFLRSTAGFFCEDCEQQQSTPSHVTCPPLQAPFPKASKPELQVDKSATHQWHSLPKFSRSKH
jgi:hypothetical protein